MKTIRPPSRSKGLFAAICLLSALVSSVFAQSSGGDLVPVVTIQAADDHGTWAGDPASFTVFRTGNPNLALNVYCCISGTASNGVDYKTIGSFVFLDVGVMSNTIVIQPVNLGQTDIRTVTVDLCPSPMLNPVNYSIGSPSSATVYLTPGNAAKVSIVNPTNGAVFHTPVDISLLAKAVASVNAGSALKVEFFAGSTDLGPGLPVVLDPPGVNGVTGLVYFFNWQNVPASAYTLAAVATDDGGVSPTSAVVNITVNPGPAATNGYITAVLRSACTDSPTPPPPVGGTRVGPGYVIKTVANADPMDWANAQQLVTDAIFESLMPLYCALPKTNCVTDSVQWNIITYDTNGNPRISGCAASGCQLHFCDGFESGPPVVRIISPPDGAVFHAPVNIPLYAYARANDLGADALFDEVTNLEFYAEGTNLGPATHVQFGPPPAPPGGATPLWVGLLPYQFVLLWTNAPVGPHQLITVAVDQFGNAATSAPVNIKILPSPPPPTNCPAVVSIVATDPVAIEGINGWAWRGETNSPPSWTAWPPRTVCLFTNYGPKIATFAVRRYGDISNDLTVSYAIGGTASNGVDYVALPGVVFIPAGERRADITIVPLDDGPPDINSSVVIKLVPDVAGTNYILGYPRAAAAVILDSQSPRAVTGMMPGSVFHLNAPGPDGAWFHVEYSTDMIHWTPVCTNQVVNGSMDFVDPDAVTNPARFYRTVPELGSPQ